MKPALRDDESRTQDGTAAVLRCPLCGDDYLHQSTVVIHSRVREDSSGVWVWVKNGESTASPLAADSHAFAGRRDDLVIDFMCEHCSETPDGPRPLQLRIMQHKGQTFIEWLPPPDAAHS